MELADCEYEQLAAELGLTPEQKYPIFSQCP